MSHSDEHKDPTLRQHFDHYEEADDFGRLLEKLPFIHHEQNLLHLLCSINEKLDQLNPSTDYLDTISIPAINDQIINGAGTLHGITAAEILGVATRIEIYDGANLARILLVWESGSSAQRADPIIFAKGIKYYNGLYCKIIGAGQITGSLYITNK